MKLSDQLRDSASKLSKWDDKTSQLLERAADELDRREKQITKLRSQQE